MSELEIITTREFLKKIPEIVTGLPKLLKGIKISNNTDKNKPVGLGVSFECKRSF